MADGEGEGAVRPLAQPPDRDRSRALIESQHRFPGPYTFRVVVRPARRAEVVSAVSACLPAGAIRSVGERPSRKGAFVSVRVEVTAPSVDEVLDIYDVLQKVDGVLAVL